MPSLAEGAATKPCTKCGEWKPAADYSAHPQTRDRLQSWCRGCCRAARLLRLTDPAEQERVRAKNRAWRAAHPKPPALPPPPTLVERTGGKPCSKCGVWKAASEYHRNPQTRDRLQSQCHDCCRQTNRAYRAANPEQIRAHGLADYYRHHAQRKAENLARYYANPEPNRAAGRAWAKANAERIRERTRERRRRDPARFKAYHYAWLERKRRNGGSFTTAEWRTLCAYYDFRCVCCGQEAPLEADHVIPLSKGGSNHIANIQPLCGTCNRKKWARYIDYRPSFEEQWRCVS